MSQLSLATMQHIQNLKDDCDMLYDARKVCKDAKTRLLLREIINTHQAEAHMIYWDNGMSNEEIPEWCKDE